MTDNLSNFFLAGAALVFFSVGWVAGLNKVASDCDRQGAFSVGTQIYQCEVKR